MYLYSNTLPNTEQKLMQSHRVSMSVKSFINTTDEIVDSGLLFRAPTVSSTDTAPEQQTPTDIRDNLNQQRQQQD